MVVMGCPDNPELGVALFSNGDDIIVRGLKTRYVSVSPFRLVIPEPGDMRARQKEFT